MNPARKNKTRLQKLRAHRSRSIETRGALDITRYWSSAKIQSSQTGTIPGDSLLDFASDLRRGSDSRGFFRLPVKLDMLRILKECVISLPCAFYSSPARHTSNYHGP